MHSPLWPIVVKVFPEPPWKRSHQITASVSASWKREEASGFSGGKKIASLPPFALLLFLKVKTISHLSGGREELDFHTSGVLNRSSVPNGFKKNKRSCARNHIIIQPPACRRDADAGPDRGGDVTGEAFSRAPRLHIWDVLSR